MTDDSLPEPDRIEGAPHPRETLALFGQQAAEATADAGDDDTTLALAMQLGLDVGAIRLVVIVTIEGVVVGCGPW